MSAEKKHDYHLVDPSPWPIYVSFSCLVLAIGTIFYMHNDVSWGMYLGLALVIYGAYMWFRDVVIEAEHQGHHTPVVQIHHRYGMTLFIASEVMFFVAWFWAYFDISLFPNEFVGNVWPPKDIETFDPWDIPLINTLVLLLSGTTVTWAHHSLIEGDRKGFIQGLNTHSYSRFLFYFTSSLRISSCYFRLFWSYLWRSILYGNWISWISCYHWNNIFSGMFVER
jgi:cytochrome c oxidase subunit 3